MNPSYASALSSLALVALHAPLGVLALTAWGRWPAAPPPAPAAIVVPGARVYADGTPSPALRRRVTRAAALWHAHPSARFVISGAGGESEVGAQLATEAGVSAEQIVQEPSAIHTAGNAAHTHALLGDVAIAVVTDDVHLLRATVCFRRHFSTVYPVAAHTPGMPWRNGVREVGAWWTWMGRALRGR
jgi:uncharacterized SAM-binding protein YcdF (DUF218 family)